MNAIRQIVLLLRNTLLVTLAVAGGFLLGGAIGIPPWLQIVCLIPAGILFLRLSGDPIPPMRRWGPYAVAITALAWVVFFAHGLLQTCFPAICGSSWSYFFLFGIAFLPMRALAAFIEHHWPFGGVETSSTSSETKKS